MNSFQSAYTKFNYWNHFTCCTRPRLDLSAAFETIDHSILLHRLKSWFGFNDTVLSWITPIFHLGPLWISWHQISPSQLLYGVPQGSVLGSLLFILYTTPLGTIISRSSFNHKLYADDTQLFLSFSADAFSEKIQLTKYNLWNIFMDGF